MIDFVDEVPQGEVLYHITETVDTQGNKAYRIELATEVTPGTPMNKVLFDSIKTDLDNKVNKSEIVKGTFTWRNNSNVTISLGFTPRLVIINSNLFQTNLGETEGSSVTAVLMSNVGNIYKARFESSTGTVGTLASYCYKNPFNSNNVTIPALINITHSNYANDVTATYIAFK